VSKRSLVESVTRRRLARTFYAALASPVTPVLAKGDRRIVKSRHSLIVLNCKPSMQCPARISDTKTQRNHCVEYFGFQYKCIDQAGVCREQQRWHDERLCRTTPSAARSAPPATTKGAPTSAKLPAVAWAPWLKCHLARRRKIIGCGA
jgi:hypothetical protein